MTISELRSNLKFLQTGGVLVPLPRSNPPQRVASGSGTGDLRITVHLGGHNPQVLQGSSAQFEKATKASPAPSVQPWNQIGVAKHTQTALQAASQREPPEPRPCIPPHCPTVVSRSEHLSLYQVQVSKMSDGAITFTFIHTFMSALPAAMFSRNNINMWSVLKKCIGMELSKITMPVMFNEPLSFLQRLTEYMEHTYLIHKANTSQDSIHRMKCVAAFAVSAVASQWERTGKPFNPLLGETYELLREDLGFRWISEQVSHHPPVSAFHAEGIKNDFMFHGSVYPKLKFWGKSVEAEPRGIITLELPVHNEAYTWTNPICCIHNIIMGQLWIEQYGNVEIINHNKKKICALYGKWTECLYSVDPAMFDAHSKSDVKRSEKDRKGSAQSNNAEEEPDEMPPPEAETVQVIQGSELIWRTSPRPDNSGKYYAFTSFALQLNEWDADMERVLPHTDCRLRPDIRALENGHIDVASAEKNRLEEKQRMARRNLSKSNEEWKISPIVPYKSVYMEGLFPLMLPSEAYGPSPPPAAPPPLSSSAPLSPHPSGSTGSPQSSVFTGSTTAYWPARSIVVFGVMASV
ncbi:Oxysterol-binding protein-related protein 1 [Anabarilius grahami]|uniref:Oxysterol-binding protein n=1 Tax=Anabarilius grahami TaxID=495550 RepID=A0A3N0YKQ5_ANAGA|nr:Oxysterol-binding protein-related protein 1 [Anabarilius grahami]